MSAKKERKAASELRSLIERVERLIEDKKAIGDDMKAVFAEAKAAGFEPKTMRKIIKERATEKAELEEEAATLDLYRHALGMADELPLFAYFKAAGDPANARPIADALGEVLPPGGEVILKTGSKPLRIWKNPDGKVLFEEWTPGVSSRRTESDSAEADVLKFRRKKKPDLKVVEPDPAKIADAMASALQDKDESGGDDA